MMAEKNGWPKAIFYDSKNTLFDWSHQWVIASKNILKKYGSSVDSEEFKLLWHRLLISENHRTAFSTYRDFTVALEESLLYAFRYFMIPGDRNDVKFMLDLWDSVEPFPDTVPALKRQMELTKVWCFSNVETEYLKMMVDKMGKDCRPDFVGTMAEAGCCKPSPRAYYWVLEQNGMRMEDVLYCARPQWDVQGAMHLGMKGVWLNRTGEPVDGIKPDYEVSDLHGLTKIVEEALG